MHEHPDIDNIRLDMKDRISIIADRIGKPNAFSNTNPRLRNLNIIWQFYRNYLETALKHGPGPGYPIWLVDDSFKLERLIVGTNTLTRSWFEERPPKGTEIFWPHPYKDEGYQWWILSWTLSHGLYSIIITHWMIERDEDLKRNTVYFTRQIDFKEETGTGDFPQDLASTNTNLQKVPDAHRRRVMDLARHATQHDSDEWILTISSYSLLTTIWKLHNMIKILDVGDVQQYYIHEEFKAFWLRRVLDALWDGEDWRPSISQIDFDGLLEASWYVPRTSHDLDKVNFEKIKSEWVKYREWYINAHSIWLGIMHGKKLEDLLPPDEDT